MMSAKEYLKQIKHLDAKINLKQQEIKDIRNRMTGCQGISYEPKIGVSGAINTKSPQEKYLSICIEYEEELAEDVDNLMLLKREAMHLIDQINDANCIDVLYKRYFEYKKWEEIAVEMDYDYRTVLRIHGKALVEFNKIINPKEEQNE